MNKRSSRILGAMLVAVSFSVLAEQVPEGTWNQTSSTLGDCPNCTITIENKTPHIIEITSNNDWIGYAYYYQSEDIYKGASEWKAGEGGAYENHVFLIELTYEGNTLTIRNRGTNLDGSSTYRRK